ncbi:Mor transcription activator family protein [Methylomagnum ishizawai]|uniref:Mor transcription activator family protein n=1 Tax=Methylomagnum ishizawai TaxID=1760988 RepID=UPI001C335220|nr:Mor transcription activator family protein [Methylomagnum ishizawai]BBL75597.1 hypothetical protein MishRS11D_26950 [Methylomagnum ishizawai]
MSTQQDAALSLRWKISQYIRQTAPFLSEKFAEDLACGILDFLYRDHGAGRVYIPAPSLESRDEAIRREFNGSNLKELMEKYHLSKSRVYEIVNGGK